MKRRVRENKGRGLIKFVFPLYLFIGVFALIWLGTAVVNLEYGLGQLERQKIELVKERKFLLAERASLYSAEKIEEIAIKHLSMSLPEREKVFFVKSASKPAPYKVSMKSVSGIALPKEER